jgi:hypothetical protein
MIWVILAFLGVPLWLCAIALLSLVLRNRSLRRRPGNLPVRVLRPGRSRWMRGHAVWVSDVLAWRGSPAAWTEELAQVTAVDLRQVNPGERKPLHRLGDAAVVAVLTTVDGRTLLVAAADEHRSALQGPFASRSNRPTTVAANRRPEP